jgi:hypothetical protein
VTARDDSGGAGMSACRWCDKPATTTREVVPAEIKNKLVIRPAVQADVCDEHAAMIDANVRRAELERQIQRLNARLKRTDKHTPRHAIVTRELGAARLELAELNS